MSEKLTELLERVRAATGPDRSIDASLFAVAHGPLKSPWPEWVAAQEERRDDFTAIQRFTDSIDAALALTERVLPGWKRQLLEKRGGNAWIARVSSPRWDTYSSGEEGPFPPTAPLAIIAATLAALIAQAETP